MVLDKDIQVFDDVMMAQPVENLKLTKPVVFIALPFAFRSDAK